MPRLLSIVIPSHRRVDRLRSCLESVTRNALKGTEILVIDDGSTNAIVSATARDFDAVRTIRRGRQGGFCSAVNVGLNAVSGDIVELLNDDTEVEPGWAEAALTCFEDARVAAVAPLVMLGDTNRIDSAGDRYYVGGVASKRGHKQPLTEEYLQPCEVFGASASSAFYRRSLLEKVGAFPEDFGAYFEDVDVAFRLRRAGGIIRYEPASRVRHYVSSSYGASPSRRVLEQQSLNEERVFWRNLPLSAVPKHVAVLAGKTWRRWEEGTMTPFALGRLRVLGETACIARHRKRLESIGNLDLRNWSVDVSYGSDGPGLDARS